MSDTARAFDALLETIRRLRAPDGCPWDRAQTPESLRACLLEEAYECVEAIDERDAAHIKEELGDALLVVLSLAFLYEGRGDFSIAAVCDALVEKLIRRHPHVFGGERAADAEAALESWREVKRREGRPERDSALDEVSRALPPLERAHKLQKTAAKIGFDWPALPGVWSKIEEESAELKAEITAPPGTPHAAAIEHEAGDLLFSVVNLCRYLGINPALALRGANGRFESRFKYVEKEAEKRLAPDAAGKYALKALDALWDEAKEREKNEAGQT